MNAIDVFSSVVYPVPPLLIIIVALAVTWVIRMWNWK